MLRTALPALVVIVAGVVAVLVHTVDGFSSWTRPVARWHLDELLILAVGGVLAGLVVEARCRLHRDVETDSLRRARRQLAVTSERYRSLFDYHPASVFSLDLDGRFLEANPAGEGLVGYPLSEILEKHFLEFVASQHVELSARTFQDALRREPREVEIQLHHRDGHLIDGRVTCLPIIVDDEVVGVYGILVDITEENRIRRKLAAALASAEQANEAKSRFLANVSHEIRTPLTSLLGTTELLEDTGLDEQQARFVEVVNRSGQRLLTLVNDILDIARIDAGETRVQCRPFDVRRLVGDVVSLYDIGARRKGLELHCDLSPGVPEEVVGDPDRLAQVLTNLVDNAIKFTEHGCVVLRVCADRLSAHGPVLRIDVADSGIGVGTVDQESVFEAFHQVDTSVTRKYGGAGLGLTISRNLIELMGGSLSVESSPGKGSTFSIELPLDPPVG